MPSRLDVLDRSGPPPLQAEIFAVRTTGWEEPAADLLWNHHESRCTEEQPWRREEIAI